VARAALALLLLASAAAAAGPKKAVRHTARKHAATKHAASRFVHPDDPADTPAVRYGALSPEACKAELKQRAISYQDETAKGVLVPVRLTGPLHGVTFRTELPEAQRATTPWEIADCRLVLALDDFAAILEKHDIVEVIHYSIYRVAPKSWPDDKIGGQHNGGLALDAGRFVKRDGTKLVVLDDFHGKIGDKTCGDGAAPRKPTPAAKELREILCEAVDDHLFNVVLTPDFNRPHRNHFHLEVMAGVQWFLVH
jgi:hypothetical protein